MHITFLFLSNESANPRLLGELASDLAPFGGIWGSTWCGVCPDPFLQQHSNNDGIILKSLEK